MTTISWVPGTACDLFLSLSVLHHANEYGVRPAWAAGVRQRIPPKSREILDKIFSFSSVPLSWISRLPAPQDAQTAINAIADISPADRIPMLTIPVEIAPRVDSILKGIAARGKWIEEERTKFVSLFRRGPHPSPHGYDNLLNTWTNLPGSGEMYLEAIQEYQNVFFAEEEARIRPSLEQGLSQARSLSAILDTGTLVEHLSRGVRLEDLETLSELTLIPSWWVTPLAYLSRPAPGKTLLAFGVRPNPQPGEDDSGAPEMLVSVLKTLGEPTRLRILRYLSTGPLSPSELARRLRLRPPTVIHHLRLLRIAGLVQITISENLEKRYTARLDALKSLHTTLLDYLETHV